MVDQALAKGELLIGWQRRLLVNCFGKLALGYLLLVSNHWFT